MVYLPLWKIWKSVGIMTFPISGKIKNVPNHQPDKISCSSMTTGWFWGYYHDKTVVVIWDHHELFGGFHKWWYPKIGGLEWKIPLKRMIWGYPHSRKPPFINGVLPKINPVFDLAWFVEHDFVVFPWSIYNHLGTNRNLFDDFPWRLWQIQENVWNQKRSRENIDELGENYTTWY